MATRKPKRSYGVKPQETMRQRQLRLLREQRARKSAATKPVRSPRGSAASTRVEPVKVKVEKQRQLPPSKPTKSLPPGQRGGAVTTSNRPRRRNVNTNPPSNTTRTGSRSASAAGREVQATRRAGVQARRPGRGGLASALATGAAIGTWMQQNLSRRPTPSGRGSGRATDRVQPGPPKKDEKNSNNAAEINARLRQQRKEKEAALAQTRGDNNSAILRPAPSPSRSTPPRSTSPRSSTPAPRAARPSDGQDLRRGRSPDPTPPKQKKKYGSKDGNNAKGRTKRLMSALKDLKVRKYKK